MIEKKTSQSSKKSTVLVVERPSKENEVEAGPTLERLDAVEEGCVVRDRLGDDVEHGGGLDLHLLGSPPPPGAKAHPLLPRRSSTTNDLKLLAYLTDLIAMPSYPVQW